MARPNWQDKTIWTADNLAVMRGMNSESIDLIYLDPPFNSKANYAAPIGSKAAGAEFKDTWTLDDVDVEWIDLIGQKYPALRRVLLAAITKSDKSYLAYMAVRILEMRRILKPTGSIYLHCDPTMSHYLKLVMDVVFGKRNFRNEIIWKRHTSFAKGSQHAPKTWGNNTDTILYYAMPQAKLRPYREMTTAEFAKQFPLTDEQGKHYYNASSTIWRGPNMGARPNLCYEWSPPLDMWKAQHPDRKRPVFRNPHASGWRLSKNRMDEEYRKGNFVVKANGKLERRKYIHDFKGKQVGNLWDDITLALGTERTGYPTQKPLALLERIIKASSDPSGDGGGGGGGVVFDPFCGCATTLVAADRLQRQWVGVDVSEKAAELVVRRIKDDQGLFQSIIPRKDIPQRTDLGRLLRYNHPKNKNKLYGNQGGNCKGCGEHFPEPRLEVDHIIATSKGGTDHPENLQLLCTYCNKIKGNRGMEYLIAQLQL